MTPRVPSAGEADGFAQTQIGGSHLSDTMRFLILLSLCVLSACSMSEPDEPPPPAPLETFQGERTIRFDAVPGFPPGTLLDLAFDGSLTAAVILNGAGTALWLEDGSGWRRLFTTDDQAPIATGPTAVCFSPGGELFVGGANAYFWRVGRDGTTLARDRFNVVGIGQEVGDWPVKQCRTASNRVFASLANDIGSDGALLMRPADFSRPSDWERPPLPFRPATRENPTVVDVAVYGLRARFVSNSFTEVVAGITYGASRPTLTAHTITGQYQYGSWVSDWLERAGPQTILPYGPPRAFAGTEDTGEAVLFLREDSNRWRILIPPPPGYADPFGYDGMAILNAPEAQGLVRTIGVDSEGHLWLGGSAMQTMRSTTPLK